MIAGAGVQQGGSDMNGRQRVLVPLHPVDWGRLQELAVRLAGGCAEFGWPWLIAVPDTADSNADRLRRSGIDVIQLPLSRLRRAQTPRAWWKYVSAFRREVTGLATQATQRGVTVVQNSGAHHLHGVSVARKLGLPLVWQMHSTGAPLALRRATSMWVARTAFDVLMTSGTAYTDQHRILREMQPKPIAFLAYPSMWIDSRLTPAHDRESAHSSVYCTTR